MNILIQLSHPAHFHFYKNVAQTLIQDGHKVFVLIKTKDILEDLCKEAQLPYYNVNAHAHRGSKMGVLWDMIMRDLRIARFCIKHHIQLITGSTPEVAHVGWLLRIPSINTGEDDAAIVPLFGKIAGPFMKCLLSPMSCNNGKQESIAVHYPGFQKLAYLHPKRFTPNAEVLKQYHIDPKKPYFLIRFAKLNAHHDTGVQGISTEVAQHIIDLLSPHGQIYITSERELEPQFEQYRLHINPLDIHHVMAYATLYIGDSQSMAVEAAMLGVPSLRFNDFVGKKKIGVMEELEHVYGLTYGISSHEPEKLYSKIQELLGLIGGKAGGFDGAHLGGVRGSFDGVMGLKSEFQARRQRMLADKIDVTAFFTWFIEHYPASAKEAKNANEEFWKKFK